MTPVFYPLSIINSRLKRAAPLILTRHQKNHRISEADHSFEILIKTKIQYSQIHVPVYKH